MNMSGPIFPRGTAFLLYSPTVSTSANPRPADPADNGAAKLSARLLEAHGADSHDVQGHTGNDAA